jgi:hypothetical protein
VSVKGRKGQRERGVDDRRWRTLEAEKRGRNGMDMKYR